MLIVIARRQTHVHLCLAMSPFPSASSVMLRHAPHASAEPTRVATLVMKVAPSSYIAHLQVSLPPNERVSQGLLTLRKVPQHLDELVWEGVEVDMELAI